MLQMYNYINYGYMARLASVMKEGQLAKGAAAALQPPGRPLGFAQLGERIAQKPLAG